MTENALKNPENKQAESRSELQCFIDAISELNTLTGKLNEGNEAFNHSISSLSRLTRSAISSISDEFSVVRDLSEHLAKIDDSIQKSALTIEQLELVSLGAKQRFIDTTAQASESIVRLVSEQHAAISTLQESLDQLTSTMTHKVEDSLRQMIERVDTDMQGDSISQLQSQIESSSAAIRDNIAEVERQAKLLNTNINYRMEELSKTFKVDVNAIFVDAASKQLTQVSKYVVGALLIAGLVGIMGGWITGGAVAKREAESEARAAFAQHYSDYQVMRSNGVATSLVRDNKGNLYVRVAGVSQASQPNQVSHGIYDFPVRK